jgi:hypothetical protein
LDQKKRRWSQNATNNKSIVMANLNQSIVIAEKAIISKIHLVRGQKVMIDRDLAEL